jgi:chromate transporter
LLFGLKAAVLAVVVEALIKVAKRAIKSTPMAVLGVAAFIAIAFFKLPFPLVIAVAALAGALGHLVGGPTAGRAVEPDEPAAAMPEWTQPSARRFFSTLAVWLAIWFAPFLAIIAWFGSGHVFADEAVFFSKMAAVTFGGAYAVLAYVAQQAVEIYGWLKPDEMLTGLGLAETTPGPLILVLVFVGFLGGARLSGCEPLLGGVAGAVVTLWFTFVPCFLWIFVGAPYVETLRNVRWLASALAAVTAAVVGVIASLGLWFALHVLFAGISEVDLGPVTLPWPDFATLDGMAALIAVVSGIALIRFKANMIAVLAAAALAGAAWSLLVP